jgi:hypothetical protein
MNEQQFHRNANPLSFVESARRSSPGFGLPVHLVIGILAGRQIGWRMQAKPSFSIELLPDKTVKPVSGC